MVLPVLMYFFVYMSLIYETVQQTSRMAGAGVTSCNEVRVMWSDFNVVGHVIALYENTDVLA